MKFDALEFLVSFDFTNTIYKNTRYPMYVRLILIEMFIHNIDRIHFTQDDSDLFIKYNRIFLTDKDESIQFAILECMYNMVINVLTDTELKVILISFVERDVLSY